MVRSVPPQKSNKAPSLWTRSSSARSSSAPAPRTRSDATTPPRRPVADKKENPPSPSGSPNTATTKRNKKRSQRTLPLSTPAAPSIPVASLAPSFPPSSAPVAPLAPGASSVLVSTAGPVDGTAGPVTSEDVTERELPNKADFDPDWFSKQWKTVSLCPLVCNGEFYDGMGCAELSDALSTYQTTLKLLSMVPDDCQNSNRIFRKLTLKKQEVEAINKYLVQIAVWSEYKNAEWCTDHGKRHEALSKIANASVCPSLIKGMGDVNSLLKWMQADADPKHGSSSKILAAPAPTPALTPAAPPSPAPAPPTEESPPRAPFLDESPLLSTQHSFSDHSKGSVSSDFAAGSLGLMAQKFDVPKDSSPAFPSNISFAVREEPTLIHVPFNAYISNHPNMKITVADMRIAANRRVVLRNHNMSSQGTMITASQGTRIAVATRILLANRDTRIVGYNASITRTAGMSHCTKSRRRVPHNVLNHMSHKTRITSRHHIPVAPVLSLTSSTPLLLKEALKYILLMIPVMSILGKVTIIAMKSRMMYDGVNLPWKCILAALVLLLGYLMIPQTLKFKLKLWSGVYVDLLLRNNKGWGRRYIFSSGHNFYIADSSANNSNGKDRKKAGEKNYSRSEVLELLYTLKAILPVGPEEWAQVAQIHNDNFPDTNRSVENLRRKYNDLYRRQIPTSNPNCPKEVKLVKKVKYLIKCKEGAGDGQEPYRMEEGYQNNTEDKEYIVSSGEEEEEDDSDDDNIPSIPLGQPSQTTTQPTQQSMEEPTQQSMEEPTQPTQPPLCQPSQPTQEPELNSTPTAINNTLAAINVPPRIVVPRSQSRSASSSSSSQQFVPAARASPSPTSTPQSKRQYRRNVNVNTNTNTNTSSTNNNNTTNERQEILDFLIDLVVANSTGLAVV
eukprot:jgi/Psemu1/27299/gm1.27299_g